MKKTFFYLTLISIFIVSCSPTTTEEVEEIVPDISVPESETEEDASSAPAATVEIVLGAEPKQVEGYPEPEAVVEADAYPEPEQAEVVVEAGDQLDNQDEGQAAVAGTFVPDIAGIGDVEIVFVSAKLTGENIWSFSVTLEHEETGWEDYADGWDVVLPDGVVIKPDTGDTFTRLLAHPHVNEQPFTRSQSGIVIPAEVDTVFVRAHDLEDGYSSMVVMVDLTAASGDRFEVLR